MIYNLNNHLHNRFTKATLQYFLKKVCKEVSTVQIYVEDIIADLYVYVLVV